MRPILAASIVAFLTVIRPPSIACAQQASLTPRAPLSAEDIMARVAANQDQSDAERTHYLYVQHARVSSRKGKTIRCEEITDTRVTPDASGSQRHLLSLQGRLLTGHTYVNYTQPPSPEGKADAEDHEKDININLSNDDSMDRDLVENMRNNLTRDKSKDGIGTGLFPLTSKTQAGYAFHLLGIEHLNGREVFHIAFSPKDKDDYDWKGDAYIDTSAFQPVLVRTALSHKVPFAVRTLLGTNVPGLGFTVIYAPQPGGLWFPVSFGTEFKIRLFYFFSREITLAAENRDFEQTHVNSRIVAADPSLSSETPHAP